MARLPISNLSSRDNFAYWPLFSGTEFLSKALTSDLAEAIEDNWKEDHEDLVGCSSLTG